jgi:YD repeat-containing protein
MYADTHEHSASRHRLFYQRPCGWTKASEVRLRLNRHARYLLLKRKRQWFVLSQVLDRMDKSLTLEQKFQEQADKWRKETQHLSSPAQKMMHPSYQAVLGMGNENPREIVRLMIQDMQQHRTPWFWALSYFAQDNPISQSDAGRRTR